MMTRSARLILLTCAFPVSSTLGAQRVVADTIVVRTFPLQFLSNVDAAKLVSPYALMGGSRAGVGVFETGYAVHGITVRATASVMILIDSLLKTNDRAPATIVLRLQVIAASDSSIHDGTISELDAELHGLFRFNGYRLLSQTTVRVDDNSNFSTTMRGPNGDQLTIQGGIGAVRREGSRSVQMNLTLSRHARQSEMVAGALQTETKIESLLHTGLSVPVGQTVVVGSAMAGGSTPAIILTVRPEIAAKP